MLKKFKELTNIEVYLSNGKSKIYKVFAVEVICGSLLLYLFDGSSLLFPPWKFDKFNILER